MNIYIYIISLKNNVKSSFACFTTRQEEYKSIILIIIVCVYERKIIPYKPFAKVIIEIPISNALIPINETKIQKLHVLS